VELIGLCCFLRAPWQGNKKLEFDSLGYYAWIYQGSQALSNFMTFCIIAGFLLITCFPIWPHFLKASRCC
jgi:hypothetical protein